MLFILFVISVTKIQVLKSDASGIEFIYTLDYKKQPVIEFGEYLEPGMPNLPTQSVFIGVPAGAKVSLEILDYSKEVIDTEISQVKSPWVRDSSVYRVYKLNKFLPEKLVEIVEHRHFRSQEYVKLRISPLRYNPLQKKLLCYKKIRVRVTFKGGRGQYVNEGEFERILRKTLLNYNEAKKFRIPRRKIKGVKLPKSQEWLKIKIIDEGIYKITYNDLKNAGITPEFIDPKTIRIYNGGSKLKIDYNEPLREIPIYVSTDSFFKEGAYILFYATSLAGWGKNEYKTYYNPYTDTNIYWLTYGIIDGRRDSIEGFLGEFGKYIDYFIDTIHVEENKICPSKAGLAWIWQDINRTAAQDVKQVNFEFDASAPLDDSCTIIVGIYPYYKYPDTEKLLHNIRLLSLIHI